MHKNKDLAEILRQVQLGVSIAEDDTRLQGTRIETSAYTDLLADRVDLIPGTKGSGKSALFRIFVDFLPSELLARHKVVVAHGIEAPGDPVFQAFSEQFATLSEEDFISFWCIYLVSLANEQFVRGTRFKPQLKNCEAEVYAFQRACANARIPSIEAKKSLRDILEWSLGVLKQWRPKLSFTLPSDSGELALDLFGEKTKPLEVDGEGLPLHLPTYVNEIKVRLEQLLNKAGVSLWLMVDRLDEVFERRSKMERLALRGLLHTMRYFTSDRIRLKLFLRDDMLDQVVRDEKGFTSLTHVTARAADTIRWTQDQVLSLVVKRFFANDSLAAYLGVKRSMLDISADYRREVFYRVFPQTVLRGTRQSATIKWIFTRCSDGRGVVTPRDVLDLLIPAVQKQQDLCAENPTGTSEKIVTPTAIKYGFEQMSNRKVLTFLKAEFPHWWKDISKFERGKTDYSVSALSVLLGPNWETRAEDFVAIGLLMKRRIKGSEVFSIPPLYHTGLRLTRGAASPYSGRGNQSSPVPFS